MINHTLKIRFSFSFVKVDIDMLCILNRTFGRLFDSRLKMASRYALAFSASSSNYS